MLKTITAGLLALLAAMTPAYAADIIVNKKCKDGTIDEIKCGYFLIHGEIQNGDGKKFTDLVAANSTVDTYLYLNSPGGSFVDGMTIAKFVHQQPNFRTDVDNSDECTSMCAIIWLAGSKRYYGGKAKIGFHSMSTVWVDNQGNRIEGRQTTTYNAGNALVGAFYNQLGLSDEAIAALTDANFNSMFYINTKRLEELGITAKRKTT